MLAGASSAGEEFFGVGFRVVDEMFRLAAAINRIPVRVIRFALVSLIHVYRRIARAEHVGNIPTAPGLDSLVPVFRDASVIRREEVDEFIGGDEQA